AAGVDLAFHHPDRARQRLGGDVRIGCPQHRHALRDRHAKLMQQRLGLVFMDIHLDAPKTPAEALIRSGIPYTNAQAIPKRRLALQAIALASAAAAGHLPSRSGAILRHASTRPCTAPTDLSKASRSLPVSSISTMRSTPF